MTDFIVDPTPFLEQRDENPTGPLIPMVVSLTFPGMDEAARNLQDEFTRIAFDSVRDAGGGARGSWTRPRRCSPRRAKCVLAPKPS